MLDYLWIIVSVLLLLGFVGYFVYLYKTEGKEVALAKLRGEIYKLMLTAERDFNKKKGQEKLEWVVFIIIQSFPDVIEKYIDKERSVAKVKVFVQFLYDLAKDKADDGKVNNS